jgi:hypothetical protein
LAALLRNLGGGHLTQAERKYWFPAKRYGWGWGIPGTWQGWLVLAVYGAMLVVGIFLFPPSAGFGPYILYLAVVSALPIVVCWLKGEPPRWRWGKE